MGLKRTAFGSLGPGFRRLERPLALKRTAFGSLGPGFRRLERIIGLKRTDFGLLGLGHRGVQGALNMQRMVLSLLGPPFGGPKRISILQRSRLGLLDELVRERVEAHPIFQFKGLARASENALRGTFLRDNRVIWAYTCQKVLYGQCSAV